MGEANRNSGQRPRELRRRVVLPARLKSGTHWSDTCILNISSRGLMIQSARPAMPGSFIELRRGDHVIIARVMWRDGSRLGLQSDDRLPVDEILSQGHAKALQLVASEGALVDRRKKPRLDADRARAQGRALESVATIAIAIMLGAGAWEMAHRALAKPLAAVQAALPD